jgi:hypothetical protein
MLIHRAEEGADDHPDQLPPLNPPSEDPTALRFPFVQPLLRLYIMAQASVLSAFTWL